MIAQYYEISDTMNVMLSSHPLYDARKTMLSLTSSEDASHKINELKSISPGNLTKHLDEYYGSVNELIHVGDVYGTLVMLRVFNHYNVTTHDQNILSSIVKAEKVHEKHVLPAHSPEIADALNYLTSTLKKYSVN